MKALLALVVLLLTTPLYAQQNPIAAACGAHPTDFSVKRIPSSTLPTQPPPGKALVYIIETMPDVAFVTKKVNIGLDGNWLGATDRQTYISFTVDPGVHHLCAVYQGQAVPMQDGDQTLLLHLDAKAGSTYYLHYHAVFIREPLAHAFAESYGGAFFTKVDEDEGQYLLQSSQQAVSKPKAYQPNK